MATTTSKPTAKVVKKSLPSSPTCEFEAEAKKGEIEFELSYEDLRGEVLQAHIHFAQEGVNGGIVVFLCTNLGNNPSNEPVPE